MNMGEPVGVRGELLYTMAVAGGAFMGGVFLLGQAAAAFVLWLGGRLVMENHLSIGQLTSFMLFVVMVAANLGMLSGVWPAFMTALGASEKVFYLIDRKPVRGQRLNIDASFGNEREKRRHVTLFRPAHIADRIVLSVFFVFGIVTAGAIRS